MSFKPPIYRIPALEEVDGLWPGWASSLNHSLRQFIRLLQCPVCSNLIQDARALPCGWAVCDACVPPSYMRQDASWPRNRLLSFRCPILACRQTHATADSSTDFVLRAVVDAAKNILDTAHDSVKGTRETYYQLYLLSVAVVKPNVHIDSSLKALGHPQPVKVPGPAGKLVELHSLVKQRRLPYGTEVEIQGTPQETPNAQASEDRCVQKLDDELLEAIKKAVRDHLECRICLLTFFDPITTSCGHTFCRPCLEYLSDAELQGTLLMCALCRSKLSMRPQILAANLALTRFVNFFWPGSVPERLENAEASRNSWREKHQNIPFIVSPVVFPRSTARIIVSDPKFIPVVRRVCQGDRFLGLVFSIRDALAPYGTLVKAVSHTEPSSDLLIVDVIGIMRMFILECHKIEEHGCYGGRWLPLFDANIPCQQALEVGELTAAGSLSYVSWSPHVPRIPRSMRQINATPTASLIKLCYDFVNRESKKMTDYERQRITMVAGPVPEDEALFPFWFARVLPLKEDARLYMLSKQTVRERYKLCWQWIILWESGD